MNQIALPLDWPENERDDEFILSAANAAVARHLEHWALWPVPATILTPQPIAAYGTMMSEKRIAASTP